MDYLLSILKMVIALFAIMNPISAGAIMLTLLHEEDYSNIKNIARRNSLAVLIAMMVILLIGNLILAAFGITVFAIKVFGGLILMLMAINMVQGERPKKLNQSKKELEVAQEREDISLIPLAIPIIVGPGLIAYLISYPKNLDDLPGLVVLVSAIIINTLLNYLVLSNALQIRKIMGLEGLRVFSRIMGLIVGAISVQFIVQGVKAIVQTFDVTILG
jgi:multiple antibiotic resistance protein